MTLTQTPGSAASTAAAAAEPGPNVVSLPTGYVALDDSSVLERMLRNIADNAALLAAVKAHHTLDAGGPLMSAFTRLVGMEEAEAIEVRHIANLLGGAS